MLYANFNNYVHAFKGSLVKRTQWVRILFLFNKLMTFLYSTHTKIRQQSLNYYFGNDQNS